jgi:hypothetical protein
LGVAAADSGLDKTEGAAAARAGEVVARRSADAAPLVFDVSRWPLQLATMLTTTTYA